MEQIDTYSSGSVEDSFHIISRESRESSIEPSNEVSDSAGQRNHISLTEQDEAAEHSQDAGKESSEATRVDPSSSSHTPTTPPVPKPRTNYHFIVASKPQSPQSPVPLKRTRSFSKMSVESLQSRLNLKEKELEEMEQLHCEQKSEIKRLTEEVERERATNRHLEQRSSQLQLPPDFDVEESLWLQDQVREKESELAAVRESKLQLQLSHDETTRTLRAKEHNITRQESVIEGLQVELRGLKGEKLATGPFNKRIELRLNEAMGEVKKLKKLLQATEKERDGLQERVSELEGRHREEVDQLKVDKMKVDGNLRAAVRDKEQLSLRNEQLRREMDQLTKETLTQAQQEKVRLEERVREMEERWETERSELNRQLEEERERVKKSDSAAQSREAELQRLQEEQVREAEVRREREMAEVQQKCDSHEAAAHQLQESCETLRQELSGLKGTLSRKDSELSHEQENKQRSQRDLSESRRTCEAYKKELQSVLDDLKASGQIKEHLEQEKLTLQGEVENWKRMLRSNKEQWQHMEEELARTKEREKRLESQRDELQSREELMDLQLKQYMTDFEEERNAREKLVEMKQLLESREKAKDLEILRLRGNLTEISSHNSELSAQVYQYQQQLQNLQRPA